jgi:outer membrane protein OmpA-like peptidoglycan-associated protein
MIKNIILILSICLTTQLFAQERSFFKKTYSNSKANLEFGVGYLFNPQDKPTMIKYQVASRNILLNNKLGFMYTLEANSDEIQDVFGLNYRISNSLSLQAGSGLTNYNVFNSEEGTRKEISIAYHPDYMPLTITTGYSTSMGPSLGFSFRIFFNKEKDEKIIQSKDKISKVNKEVRFDKLKNTVSSKKIDSTKKNIVDEKNTKQVSQEKNSNNNLESLNKKPLQQKTDQKILLEKKLEEKKITNNLESIIKKTLQKKIVQKEIKKPAINTDKLCNDSKVLYPLNIYKLSSLEKSNLKKLSKYLKNNPKSILKIFGSTDKSGSEEYNMILSTKRANSSKNFLIELGVSRKQLETINLGESKSQNANSEQERAKARSTTFQIIIK